jgi:hypothetical protein
MLLIKMMSGEDKPDGQNDKSFDLVQVNSLENVKFFRDSEDEKHEPIVRIFKQDGEYSTYYPKGNTYVLNENGKTIATFAHCYFDIKQ